jgi:hypothetical protein
VERLYGKTEQYALNIATEFIRDMQAATLYPPNITGKPTALELTQLTLNLIDRIALRKKEVETQQAAATTTDGGETTE